MTMTSVSNRAPGIRSVSSALLLLAAAAATAQAVGPDVAASIVTEEVAQQDWVSRSLAGLAPVRAGRFIIYGAHDRA
ncbi:MAG: hypothetical protein NTV94_04460, partial [Planctomycetota bacterium]|nr:hypothetical protein [Planctomycetota bacterium]